MTTQDPSGKKVTARMRVEFKKPLPISGVFIPRRPVAGSRRFGGTLSGFSVVGRDRNMVFLLADGPVRAVTFASVSGTAEAMGLDASGVPVLLSGVMVGDRSLAQICLEWQQTLVS